MAHPKRRWSKERTHLKRSTWKIEAKNIAACSNCGEPVLSHIACPACGFYDGKKVMEIKSKEKETK